MSNDVGCLVGDGLVESTSLHTSCYGCKIPRLEGLDVTSTVNLSGLLEAERYAVIAKALSCRLTIDVSVELRENCNTVLLELWSAEFNTVRLRCSVDCRNR